MRATGFRPRSFVRRYGCTSGSTLSLRDVEDLLAERGIIVPMRPFGVG